MGCVASLAHGECILSSKSNFVFRCGARARKLLANVRRELCFILRAAVFQYGTDCFDLNMCAATTLRFRAVRVTGVNRFSLFQAMRIQRKPCGEAGNFLANSLFGSRVAEMG